MTREAALHLLSRTPDYRCATLRDNALELREALVAALDREEAALSALANERGIGPAPDGWERNDLEPPAIAWYRRVNLDGSEPDENDTPQTRVLWTFRAPPDEVETTERPWKWEIEHVQHRSTLRWEGTANTAREAMEAADAALVGTAVLSTGKSLW